jgi:hypothetical protein
MQLVKIIIDQHSGIILIGKGQIIRVAAAFAAL